MKKALSSVAAVLLMAGAGLANASEPVALTDGQMDNVAAGVLQGSMSSGGALALIGASASASNTSSLVTPIGSGTNAGSTALAIGLVPVATTSAGSFVAR